MAVVEVLNNTKTKTANGGTENLGDQTAHPGKELVTFFDPGLKRFPLLNLAEANRGTCFYTCLNCK